MRGKNMNENEALWYLPGKDDQPRGPYTTDQIMQWCQTGQLDGATLCWRQGMDNWQPLTNLEPFREVVPAKVEPAAATDVAEVAKRGMKEIRKAFGKAVSATKRKARTTSLRLSVSQHEKRKQQILYELGKMFYEGGSDLLAQSPYSDKTQLVKAEEQAIQQLHQQIEALEKPKQAPDAKAVEVYRADE